MENENTLNGMDSIDAIDAALANEFNIKEGDDLEVESNEDVDYADDDGSGTVVDDVSEDSQDDVDLGENSENEDEENEDGITNHTGEGDEPETDGEVDSTKPTKEEKAEYAFAQMRQENNRLQSIEGKLSQFAKNRGYDDLDKFLEDLTVADDTLESQKQGVDPAVYRETMKLKREKEELEQQLNEINFERQVENLRSVLDEVIEELDLGDTQEATNEIIRRCEENGITTDKLIGETNRKALNVMIRGVLTDKIQDKVQQKQVNKLEKLNKIADEKHINSNAKGKKSLDDIIAKEMAEYKADNYL